MSQSSEQFISPSKLYPTRSRKRNRFIYNDDEETDGTPTGKGHPVNSIPSPVTVGSPRKSVRISASSLINFNSAGDKMESKDKAINSNSLANLGLSPVAHSPMSGKSLDKKVAQRLGMRLRTLLKLPKAHKWVCYEWFYANIDQPLFVGENDFQIYLKESFPNIKTRMLKRVEWCKIRRLMGKPRRCSQAFFAEERTSLNAKRNKIRQVVQQQKVIDISQYRELPENIPLSLVIGTKVTGLLRHPQDGLFTGTIDAVDTVNGTYRITFDRSGIGTHSVPDYEVLSSDQPEFMPLSSFQTKVRPRLPLFTSPRFLELLGTQVSQALGDSESLSSTGHVKTGAGSSGATQDEDTLGGFPIKFLGLLVRLSKILAVKKRKIYEFKSMNSEAEKFRSLQEPIGLEFQKQYAGTILELEKLNTDLNDHLKAVQQYSAEMAPEQGLSPLTQPELVKQRYLDEARDLVQINATTCSVKSQKSVEVITHLLSIMLHLRGFADTDVSSYELKSLNDALEDTRKLLEPSNVSTFENHVEVHVNHIQSSLSHLGNLGAFSESVE